MLFHAHPTSRRPRARPLAQALTKRALEDLEVYSDDARNNFNHILSGWPWHTQPTPCTPPLLPCTPLYKPCCAFAVPTPRTPLRSCHTQMSYWTRGPYGPEKAPSLSALCCTPTGCLVQGKLPPSLPCAAHRACPRTCVCTHAPSHGFVPFHSCVRAHAHPPSHTPKPTHAPICSRARACLRVLARRLAEVVGVLAVVRPGHAHALGRAVPD